MYPDHDNFTGGWTLLANPTYLWVAGSFDGICTPDGVTQCVPASFTPTSGKGTMSIARFTL